MWKLKNVLFLIGSAILAIGTFVASFFTRRNTRQAQENRDAIAASKAKDSSREDDVKKAEELADKQIAENEASVSGGDKAEKRREEVVRDADTQIEANDEVLNEAKEILGGSHSGSK